MKILYYILISIALLSYNCENRKKDNEINVQIINNLDARADSVKLYTADISIYLCDSVLIEDIEPKTEKNTQWYNITPCESDGTYLVRAYFKEKILEKSSGYYTNGILLHKKISITIENDSLFISTAK